MTSRDERSRPGTGRRKTAAPVPQSPHLRLALVAGSQSSAERTPETANEQHASVGLQERGVSSARSSAAGRQRPVRRSDSHWRTRRPLAAWPAGGPPRRDHRLGASRCAWRERSRDLPSVLHVGSSEPRSGGREDPPALPADDHDCAVCEQHRRGPGAASIPASDHVPVPVPKSALPTTDWSPMPPRRGPGRTGATWPCGCSGRSPAHRRASIDP